MGLSGAYNSPLSDEDGISVINYAFNKGITFFDTADAYGPHSNELLRGKVQVPNFYLLNKLDFLLAVNIWMTTDAEMSS